MAIASFTRKTKELTENQKKIEEQKKSELQSKVVAKLYKNKDQIDNSTNTKR